MSEVIFSIRERPLKNDYAIGGALSNIGLVYMTQSKFPEALKYYLDGLKKFEKTNTELEVSRTLAT